MDGHDEIAEASAAFASALRSGDAAVASDVYTRDARLVAPSAGILDGRDAIEAFWRAGIEVGVSRADFEPLELRRHDAVAYELGRYELALAGVGAVADRGKYVLVHERQEDGSWRRALEMLAPDTMTYGEGQR